MKNHNLNDYVYKSLSKTYPITITGSSLVVSLKNLNHFMVNDLKSTCSRYAQSSFKITHKNGLAYIHLFDNGELSFQFDAAVLDWVYSDDNIAVLTPKRVCLFANKLAENMNTDKAHLVYERTNNDTLIMRVVGYTQDLKLSELDGVVYVFDGDYIRIETENFTFFKMVKITLWDRIKSLFV